MVTDVNLQKAKACNPILDTVYACPSDMIELGITTSLVYLSSTEVTSAVLSSEFKL